MTIQTEPRWMYISFGKRLIHYRAARLDSLVGHFDFKISSGDIAIDRID